MSKKETSQRSSRAKSIVIFEDHPVRRVWNEKDEKWYFPIVDVIKVLTDSTDPSGYIKDMRRRDSELSKGWGQIATPLYAKTKGGRQKVNCANVEGTLRLIHPLQEEQTGKPVVSSENFLPPDEQSKRKRLE